MPAGSRAGRCATARSRCSGCCASRVGPDLALIAVGGIATADDARARLEAGATLLQAYTGFVYEGAGWPSRVQRELAG